MTATNSDSREADGDDAPAADDDAAALRWALIAVGLSLAVRVVWASLAEVRPVSDFSAYDYRAWKWVTTGEFDGAFRTPGYPGFLAAIYWVFGHSWRAAQVVQAVVGAVTTGLVVLLAARVASVRTAAIAGFVHALWPTSIIYVAVLASENLGVPVFLGTILALTAESPSRRRRMMATALGGVLFAVLILIRPACLGLVPAVALLALWEPRARRWRVAPALVFAAAVGLTIAPWLIRNHQRGFGATTIATTGGVNLWMGNSDFARHGGFNGGYPAAKQAGFPTDEIAWDEALRAEALRWIASHPGRYLALCAVRTARIFGTIGDGYASRHVWPTAENDAVLLAGDARYNSNVTEEDSAASRQLQKRNRAALRWFRVLTAPLILVGLVLCLRRFRRYAGVTVPALCYSGFLAATYFIERLRELSEPLLLIALAALLSDLIHGTAMLPGTRRTKLCVAAAAVALSILLRLTGLDSSFYRLDPM